MLRSNTTDALAQLEPRTRAFYLHAMTMLQDAGVPFLVGGAYALAHHAGIVRHTKDLDVFIRGQHLEPAMHALRGGGYRTDLIFPHWLGKAFHGENFVDLIFGSGNGLCRVDDEWFDNAVDGTALGERAQLCPAEEIIWTKAFVQERERFDGADIAHLLLARGPQLDWHRLLRRFTSHERVLLAQVLLFGFVFPSYRDNVPDWVMQELRRRIEHEQPPSGEVCRGTLLSRQQYLIDVHERGFEDARRIDAGGFLSDDDIQRWTAAIDTAK